MAAELRKVKATFGRPNWSNWVRASMRSAPVRMTFFGILAVVLLSGMTTVSGPVHSAPRGSEVLPVSTNSRSAVLPINSIARWGFSIPGSSATIRSRPCRVITGSATPSWSIRLRITLRTPSIASLLIGVSGVALACRTMWLPPLRSRPRLRWRWSV